MAEKQFQVDEEGILTFSASPNPPLFFEPLQSCGISSSTPPNGLQTVSICWPSKGRPAVGALTRQCLSCFFCRSLHFTFGKSLGEGLLSRIWDLELPDTCCPVSVSVSSCCFSVRGWKEQRKEWTQSDTRSFYILRWTHFKGMLELKYHKLIDQLLMCWEAFFNFKKNDSIVFLFFKSKSSICSEQHLKGLSEALKTCNVSSNEHTQEEQLFLHGAGVFCPHLY